MQFQVSARYRSSLFLLFFKPLGVQSICQLDNPLPPVRLRVVREWLVYHKCHALSWRKKQWKVDSVKGNKRGEIPHHKYVRRAAPESAKGRGRPTAAALDSRCSKGPETRLTYRCKLRLLSHTRTQCRLLNPAERSLISELWYITHVMATAD